MLHFQRKNQQKITVPGKSFASLRLCAISFHAKTQRRKDNTNLSDSMKLRLQINKRINLGWVTNVDLRVRKYSAIFTEVSQLFTQISVNNHQN